MLGAIVNAARITCLQQTLQAYRKKSAAPRASLSQGRLRCWHWASPDWPPCAGARSTKQFQPRPKRPPPAWRFWFRTQATTRVGNRVRRFAGAVAPRPASARTVGAARPLLRHCTRPPLTLERLRELDPARLIYDRPPEAGPRWPWPAAPDATRAARQEVAHKRACWGSPDTRRWIQRNATSRHYCRTNT